MPHGNDTLDCRVDGRVPAHLSSDETMTEVRTAHAQDREISDAAAVTIASWWQSPGTVGEFLAQLATAGSVSVERLLDDISNTRNADHPDSADSLALDMLATWAINHPSRTP